MKLTTNLAVAQIKGNRHRSILTLIGIILSVAMLTTVFHFAESLRQGMLEMYYETEGRQHFLLQPLDYEIAAEIAEDQAVTDCEIITRENPDGSLYWGVAFRLSNPNKNYVIQLAEICERQGLYYDDLHWHPNDTVIRLEGFGDDSLVTTFYGIAAVLAFIIMIISVVVISNAFAASAAERTRQFGLLKSVGATKHTISAIVRRESLIFAAVGIPLGIVFGLALEAVGVLGIGKLLQYLDLKVAGLHFPFVVAPLPMALAALLAIVTVAASAWLPARRAAKIPAIEAIRATGEVKLTRKSVKTSRLTQKLFGFEGTLAAKSSKRSRRSFRATVVSLTISVVLFVACGSAVGAMIRMAETTNPGITATASAALVTRVEDIPFDKILQINERFNAYEGAVSSFAAQNGSVSKDNYSVPHRAVVPDDMMTDEGRRMWLQYYENSAQEAQYFSVAFVACDPAHYAAFCAEAAVPTGSNILLNFTRGTDQSRGLNYRYDYIPFNFANQTLAVGVPDFANDETAFDPDDISYHAMSVALDGAVYDYPRYFTVIGSNSTVNILMPEVNGMNVVYWYIDVPDSAGFVEYANNVFREVLDVPALGEIPEYQGATFSTNDIAGQQAVAIRTARLLSVLSYSFAAFLTLIGLTNIISTVSANTRLRAREFAILQSVGMTRGGLSRMLNLECLLLGVKSLALGIPLGLMASLMIHAALVQTALTEFFFPWASIVECAVGVFAITLITMRVAARRVRGGSIIEVIRSSNGV